MRPSRAAGICLAIGLIAVICVGLGYALTPYYGYSYSGDNTTGTSGKTIDIYVDNGEGYVPLSGDMPIPPYGQSQAVSGNYKLYLKENGQDATGYVRLWCDMSNDASWALIKRMYVVFDGDNTQYDFGKVTRNNDVVTNVPTQAVQLTGEVSFTIYIQYVQYKDFGYMVDDDGDSLTSFAGSKFVFAFDGTDPLQ